jgi:hypothetical protein
MREASVVGGVYGAQLPDIDDLRAQAVRRTTSPEQPPLNWFSSGKSDFG